MLLFADGFDHLEDGTVDLNRKWGSVLSGSGVAPGGRRATKGITLNTLLQRMVGNQSSVIIGGAFFVGSGGGSFLFVNPVLPFGDSIGSHIFSFHCDDQPYIFLGLSTDGAIRVARGAYPYVSSNSEIDGSNPSGASTALATSAAGVVQFASWNYIEMEVSFAYGTAGSFKVWVNDDLIFNVTLVQTIPPNPADLPDTHPDGPRSINPTYVTQVRLGGTGTDGRIDDVYILNKVGSLNNARLGDLQVDYIRPDGPGAVSQSDIVGTSPAPSRWESVDDLEPDDGATAVRFDAAGEEDSYTHTDLPYSTATIHGVQVTAFARKSDSGIARARLTTRVNGEVAESAALLTPSAGDDYSAISAPFDESADGEWTLEKVQDSEFGFKRVL
jgi:hypothetical protein